MSNFKKQFVSFIFIHFYNSTLKIKTLTEVDPLISNKNYCLDFRSPTLASMFQRFLRNVWNVLKNVVFKSFLGMKNINNLGVWNKFRNILTLTHNSLSKIL